jgi:hypothetical protein
MLLTGKSPSTVSVAKVASSAVRIYCALVQIGFTFGVRALRKLERLVNHRKLRPPEVKS